MEKTYYILIAVIIVVIMVFGIDAYQVKKLKKINKKISENPNFLKDENTRMLCKEVLNQVYYKGPFTIIEMRKLNNYLKNYK